ncbi:MAG: hypothetical protein V4864_08275 [Pseudomonadota bacterium]
MSAADAPFIRRHPKDNGPLSFWGLRAQALAKVQALSADHWTDYNLHDPGVTILEQACYALTSLVYRADFPVADHLTAPDGRIDFAGHALHPADIVFPCRPATADDYRRLLLDRIEGLGDAAVEPLAPGHGVPPGIWRVELRMAAGHASHMQESLVQAVTLLRAYRNLGEDFDHQFTMVEERWCELQGEIEVGGARDPADVLADVYLCCEQQIAGGGRFVALDALLRQGAALETIFDGPPVRRGRLREPEDARDKRLFVADLMAALAAIDGVKEVRRLALVVDGEAHTGGDSVQRRGPGWALRLRVPTDGKVEGMRLMRRGSRVQPSAALVRMKYEDLQAGEGAPHTETGASAFEGPRPRGAYRPLPAYSALQDQFPAVYGINHYGLEPQASSRDKAMAWQLKAYLVLFDQVMAHSAAQLAHLRELFAVEEGGRRSYWWQMVDEPSVPGIRDRLYTTPPEHVEQRVYEPMDSFMERKGRLMDYLLSLHGETYSQNSLRQFASGHTATELEALLFENKAAVLKDIIAFSRDRAAGWDDGRPCWDEPANVAGLQRRTGLLLGFRDVHTRSLTAPLQRRGREAVSAAHWRRHAGDAAGHHAHRPEGARRVALDAAAAASREEADRHLARIGALGGPHLNEALLRRGAFADAYWIVESDDGRCHLFAGPDEDGAYWALGTFDNEQEAARAAAHLRNLLLRVSEQSEGLFVLEHVLLRPVGSSAAHQQLRQQHQLPDDALHNRLTVVFPAWPPRCGDPNFRAFAAETVELNAPAHLQAHCLWLDWPAMREFELHCERWMRARLEWCTGRDDEAARMRMNHAAAGLLRLLHAPRRPDREHDA